MIRNYFKIALRNIRRYSTHSILNISGMAIGMACAIMLLLYVQYELSYDRFYKNADCLYRVVQASYSDGKINYSAVTPFPLATALKEEYPEIVRSTRYHNWLTSFPKGENILKGKLALADKDFFEMFDIEFVRGDKKSAFNGLYDIVITEEMAKKYFGNDDPLGKTMTVEPNNTMTVTGVVKRLPGNSHFYFDCIAPFEFYSIKYGDGDLKGMNEWNNVYNYTFIELLKEADSKLVEGKIKGVLQRKMNGYNGELSLQNIKKIHLYSRGKYSQDIATGNLNYVKIASLVAILILIIACINFMNLSTAQASRRAKEIGVRKVTGANRRTVVFQFLLESLLIVFVSVIIAMILVELLWPGFNAIMRMDMEVSYRNPGLYLVLITVILFCGLLAGSYPALYLSSLKPFDTIKGVVDKNPGKAKLRRALVISQFTLSFIFIICTLIVGAQLNYMQNKALGINIDNIGHFEFTGGFQRETLKNELKNNPDILSVTITGHQDVLNNWAAVTGVNWQGKKEGDDILFSVLNADRDYAKTFQIELKDGIFLSSDEFSIDTTVVVINEKAAEIMGFANPVGEVISDRNGLKFRIIGVVKDFHFKTLHSPIEPLIIAPIPQPIKGGTCYIRMNPDHIASTVNYVRNIFKSNNLGYPLDFKFLDDDYDSMFTLEHVIISVLCFLTFMAIIISCLGLIGLSTFMTVRRTKEIGIRKTNGARTTEIFYLLSKEYLTLVIISFLIACPIAWYAGNIWLRSFAYRTKIGLWIFALAGIIVMVIAMVTVGYQTYKVASKNPVEALRYE